MHLATGQSVSLTSVSLVSNPNRQRNFIQSHLVERYVYIQTDIQQKTSWHKSNFYQSFSSRPAETSWSVRLPSNLRIASCEERMTKRHGQRDDPNANKKPTNCPRYYIYEKLYAFTYTMYISFSNYIFYWGNFFAPVTNLFFASADRLSAEVKPGDQ